MYGYVTQIAIEDAETRTCPRIILDEDNLFTFSTFFFLFDMCFLFFKYLPFFFFKSTNHHEMRLPLLRKRRSARYPPTVDQRLTVLLRDRAHYLSFGVTANCTSAFVDDGNIV